MAVWIASWMITWLALLLHHDADDCKENAVIVVKFSNNSCSTCSSNVIYILTFVIMFVSIFTG